MKKIILILLAGLLFSASANAQDSSPYCAKLDDAQTYKDNESYRYLVVGENDRIFRSRKDLKEDFTLTQETLEKFSKLNRILKSQGKTLHIVMAPTRGVLNANDMPSDSKWIDSFDVDNARKTFTRSISSLKAIGLSVANLATIPENIANNFYYKHDHHWTAKGAKFAAEKTARLITAIDKDLPHQVFKTETKPEEINIEGSFALFIEDICGTKIPDEKAPIIQTFAERQDDLFDGKPNAAVALIGTSNTTEPAPSYANFAGYMRELLQSDVENFSVQGAGIESPILSYFAADNENKKQHRHLIWELASHYDFNGDEFSPVFAQAVPAAAGACDGKEIFKTEQTIEGEKVGLPLDSAASPPVTKNNYVYIKFNKPTKKDFALSIKFKDGTAERFRFEREDRYPFDGVYFLDLDEYGEKEISALSLFFAKDFDAENFSFQSCAYPQI